MLTYESLIEQAKSREMPSTKIRGILREYLQILILKELYKLESGRRLYFTGGTYLRLAHNLKRFSEDLDFNTNIIRKGEFEGLLNSISHELKRTGVDSELEFAHWGNVYVSKMIFPGIEKAYNAISKHSKKKGIIIKVETYKTKWKIKTQTEMISGFGEFYPVICTDRGILFADKIDAVKKKERGRHIYDIMFMLSRKYAVNEAFLKRLGIRENPFEAISDEIKSFSKDALKKQAEILRPFLFDESEADLIVNAHSIIPSLIEKYKK